MTHRRLILEMGSGNDLHGGDYTKAACRAVENALRHSTLSLFGSLGLDHREMQVKVTIGVQDPDAVDVARVTAALPRGRAEVQVVRGGLDIDDPAAGERHVIATAAVEACLEVDPAGWKLAD